MPDKHLFVNMSHYQERPDPNMRHKIASHAARYGPNGSLAFKTSPEHTLPHSSQSSKTTPSRHSPRQNQNAPSTPGQRRLSLSAASSPGDSKLRQDYEIMMSRFSEFCACTDHAETSSSRSKQRLVHSDECSVFEDYIDLCAQHELPFRVSTDEHKEVFSPLAPPDQATDDGLIIQCLLVAGQAAIDGMDPNFKGRASKQTLTLQQKALSAMQKLIVRNPNTVDDSLILGSTVLMSTAGYYDDRDAFCAHQSSLKRLIDLQGGLSQSKAHRLAKTIMGAGEVCLAMYRYAHTDPKSSNKKALSNPQCPTQSPFKLKYPMPPFAPEVTKSIERMSPGFQALAKSSRLSVQALQLLSIAHRWSLLIDQPINSDVEDEQLLAPTAAANARLLDLYTNSFETLRVASMLLISLPTDTAHMKLEKAICLGFINILHSLAHWQYPLPIRDRFVVDFTETMFSLVPKDKNEEDCMIWLSLVVATEWRHCAAKMKESPLLERHGHDPKEICQIWIQRSRQLMDWIIVKSERARTFEEVAAACARFLWLRRMHGEWKATWREAMERRLRNMPRKKSRQ